MPSSPKRSLLIFAVLLALPTVAAPPPARTLAEAENLLDRGRVREADSIFAQRAPERAFGALKHRSEILAARLAAARGDWRKTDARLRTWKNSPERGGGSGEVCFWMGWSALHQGRRGEADSMLVLAGAYGDEPGSRRAQEALEYRFAALLDDSPALLDYLRGLPESPLPDSLRAASLERLPKSSRLYPYARWQLALLLALMGDTVRPARILGELAGDLSTLPGRKAAARLNAGRESGQPDSARSGYEALLLRQQQGVPAEFARKRLQELRTQP